METTARNDLERELRDPELRKLYGAAEAKSELAVALAKARHALGITQGEMAKIMGVSQPYVAKLEGGDANPTIGTVGGILGALKLRLRMAVAPLVAESHNVVTAVAANATDANAGSAFGTADPGPLGCPEVKPPPAFLFPPAAYDQYGRVLLAA